MAYQKNKPFEQAVKTLSSALFKRGMVVAWLTLIITLTITIYAWYTTKQNIEAGAREKFDFQTQEIAFAIEKRMQAYEQILRGGKGLFYASQNVSRDAWKAYVNALRIEENYPGILGIGFAEIIKKDELEKHINEIRSQGFPGYHIWPEGEREIYTSIIYLEPFNSINQRAFGYDMFSDSVRRKAMIAANENDKAFLSGKVTLVQEIDNDIQPGFLMYLPLYRYANEEQENGQELIGYIFSPFRMYDLMSEIFKDQLRNIKLEIYDEHIANENLMYTGAYKDSLEKFKEKSLLEKFRSLNIKGRDWILHFTSLPGFESSIDRQKPLIVLILGIVVSSLLFIVSRNLSNIFIINKKLEQLLESTIEGIYGIDRRGRCTFINNSAAAMLGYEPEECLKNEMHSLIHHHKDNGDIYPFYECPIIQSMESMEGCLIDSDVYWKKDGSSFPVEYSSYPIIDDGETTGAVIAFTDISERKRSYEKIEASLKEKEVLLREIHHRVKNNLQIISSMLNLQTNYITDQKSLAIFEESRNRVRSMALIHEKLYQNESLSSLNIKEYVIELINNLMRSYRTNNRVNSAIHISDIFVNTDTAIPLGLIINEIVSNSLKYAFPNNSTGKITITLVKLEENKYQISIEDNGIGLPEDFNLRETNTLGLQLVNSLVTQLDGEIKLSSNNGTKFEIKFKGVKVKSKNKLT